MHNTLSFNNLIGEAIETTVDGIVTVLQQVTICGAWFGKLIGANPLHTATLADGDRKTFVVEGVTIYSDWAFDATKGKKVSKFWVSLADAKRLHKPVKATGPVSNGVDYSKLHTASASVPAPAL